jgi:hypothetical protein
VLLGIVLVPPTILMGSLSVICIVCLGCPWVLVRAPHSDSFGDRSRLGASMERWNRRITTASKPQLQKEPDAMGSYQ